MKYGIQKILLQVGLQEETCYLKKDFSCSRSERLIQTGKSWIEHIFFEIGTTSELVFIV